MAEAATRTERGSPVSGSTPPTGLDALLPPEMARRAEEVGVRKASLDDLSMFALAVLAGAFIALGAVFATVALAGAGTAPWGAVRVLAGVVFSLGAWRGSSGRRGPASSSRASARSRSFSSACRS